MEYMIYNEKTKRMEATTEPWWHKFDSEWAAWEKVQKEEEERRRNEPLFGKGFEEYGTGAEWY